MAAGAEAARAAEKRGRSGLPCGVDDAAAGGDDAVCNDGRVGGADDRGGSDAASDVADRIECLHDDWVDDLLRYERRAHACDASPRVYRPPRH
ncbi:MAG: hypothetical protein PVI89_17155 [Desulfobacteraceae bacterium]